MSLDAPVGVLLDSPEDCCDPGWQQRLRTSGIHKRGEVAPGMGADLSGGDSALLGESCFDVPDVARLMRAGSAAVPIGVLCS